MRRGIEHEHGFDSTWTENQTVSSTGVALTVSDDADEEVTINPVGKAFKLFESGSSDSLAFMYRTSVGVLHNEL
ncbi:hypothetical protein [Halopiger djelfimassiliensis]|uniref:hypothetical protein n=1 Tax=Halopiger djelfimassiliensis TaxID=1293047 RepID=UPI0006776E6E|nr:hypothetical protein [Halopiger djelfimassiliensis]